MAFFPTATQAKDRAQGNLVIAKEVNALEEAVITAISNSAFTAEVTDDTTMTNSTPTDATSESYYKSWKGTTTNNVFDEHPPAIALVPETRSFGDDAIIYDQLGRYFYTGLSYQF